MSRRRSLPANRSATRRPLAPGPTLRAPTVRNATHDGLVQPVGLRRARFRSECSPDRALSESSRDAWVRKVVVCCVPDVRGRGRARAAANAECVSPSGATRSPPGQPSPAPRWCGRGPRGPSRRAPPRSAAPRSGGRAPGRRTACTTRSVSCSTTASCLSRSSAPAFVRTWTRTWLEAPVTSEMAAAGSSWTKAAVFSRNIGISGTRLDAHHGGGRRRSQGVRIGERPGRRVDVDHRHGGRPPDYAARHSGG